MMFRSSSVAHSSCYVAIRVLERNIILLGPVVILLMPEMASIPGNCSPSGMTIPRSREDKRLDMYG